VQAGEFSDEDFVLDHEPNRSPDEARRAGRYVLENGEHVDVMVARAKTDSEDHALDFDSAWSRRQTIEVAPGVAVHLPSLEELIATKRWASRPRDVVDIQYIEQLRQRRRT
jgi:hypothetical protein